MAKEKSQYYTLQNNIKGLRMSMGESQSDLAAAIGVSAGTIGNYESGTRFPKPEVLIKLASHFQVTSDALLLDNLSSLPEMGNRVIKEDDYVSYMEKLFPLICTPSALENENFRRAYEIHKDFCDCLIQSKDFDDNKIELCMELYTSARNEGIIEGSANYLWWAMFLGMAVVVCNPYLMENADLFNNKEVKWKDVINAGLLPKFGVDASPEYDREHEETRLAFLEEYENEILLNINLLKRSKSYSDLGDYYIVMQYLFNLVSNSNKRATNISIGFELMRYFRKFKNPYLIAW